MKCEVDLVLANAHHSQLAGKDNALARGMNLYYFPKWEHLARAPTLPRGHRNASSSEDLIKAAAERGRHHSSLLMHKLL